MGMMAELLSHILIGHLYRDMVTVSPFFNLEEASIKKGFDLVLTDKAGCLYWLVEVKSGETTTESSTTKNRALLHTAKRDLHGRIAGNRTTIWRNAIMGARTALKPGNLRKKIARLLELALESAQEGTGNPTLHNAFLTSVVFNAVTDPISFDDAVAFKDEVTNERLFRAVIVFSIQKQTYDAIFRFLSSEAEE